MRMRSDRGFLLGKRKGYKMPFDLDTKHRSGLGENVAAGGGGSKKAHAARSRVSTVFVSKGNKKEMGKIMALEEGELRAPQQTGRS